MLKYLLIPLGILSGILLALPQLVVVGYIFLIIPGLILTIIPTIFVYLLATFLIRCLLPLSPGIGATLVAAVLAVGLGFVAMLPGRFAAKDQFQQAALPDIVATERIRLTGNVLVDFPPNLMRSKPPIDCDFICTSLLGTPGIESVTRVSRGDSVTFRKGSEAPGTFVLPDQPQRILKVLDQLSKDRVHRNFQERKERDRKLQAALALQIAHGEPFRRSDPLADDSIDWRVTFDNLREKGQPRVERLEIRDSTGTVQFRKSLVTHRVPAPFFYFGFQIGSAASGFSSAKFVVGGSRYSNQERYYRLDPAVELVRAVEVSEPQPASDSLAQMEQELSEVLDDSNATELQLLLAPLWLQLFQYDAGEEHLDTIAKILLDERIPDPREPLQSALRSRTDLTPLRAGLAIRFLTATDPKSQTWYVSKLVDLPDGTFAQPTADEIAIWDLALSSHQAAPFVERLADQGQAAVPQLLAILDQSLDQRWHDRWHVLKGLRNAFKRLGPEGAQAIPRVQSLLATSNSPLSNSAKDRREWTAALTAMDVAAEDLP
ncbi:hypothetical protein FYK55_25255 [Roseiconus nitratireducens]|uniref:Uncharacterized protein n=1 Tax=Roseiconus nitratireducens TaxID=2605748 RepID=A0A5M6CW95_9BACT|nr:hypothetical protein [Roseiconus nitratireducens]KAA5539226.1 hypothetical protein FYK55_25255 [Roseiconus nitratireducens]